MGWPTALPGMLKRSWRPRVVVKTVVNAGIAGLVWDIGKGFAYSELGARTRIRTRDQLIKSQLLYQLSYAGAGVILSAESSQACRGNHRRPSALLSRLLSNLKMLSMFCRLETGTLQRHPFDRLRDGLGRVR